jgi:hypothetical protein
MNPVVRSLCTTGGAATRWYPIPVETWQAALAEYKVGANQLIPDLDLRRNLAYNLQFVEYLQQTLKELSLSAVLTTQTYKSYIIFAGGIVESLLYFLNQAKGGTDKKFVNVINRLKTNSVLGADADTYSDLDWVRQMRNKVHLQELKDDLGTDYLAFNAVEFERMKKILKKLIAAPALGAPPSVAPLLDFLD